MEKVLGVLKALRGIFAYIKEKVYFRTSACCAFPLYYATKNNTSNVCARSYQLNVKWGTICTPVEMLAPDGKRQARTTSYGDTTNKKAQA